MRTSLPPISLPTLLTTMLACVDVTISAAEVTTASDHGETGAEELGDGDGDGDGVFGIEWEEVRCIANDQGTSSCYGRPVGSVDSWVTVVPMCRFDQDAYEYEIPTWDESTCAPGLLPEKWQWGAVECFAQGLFSQSSLCFGMSWDWAAPLIPVCMIEQGPDSPWSASMCAATGAGQIGAHPWDNAWCLSESGGCYAEIGGALAAIVPTCWLDEREPAEIPSCD